MSLKDILKLMEQKYPGMTALLIYDDESGRIVDEAERPYDQDPLFEFSHIEDLVQHLQEKTNDNVSI